jgi:hypothetical protein
MAIVHPAFCGVDLDWMEPITRAEVRDLERSGRGYKTFQKPRVQLKNR